MKIFLSSLIRGFEAERAAAATAVRSLGHEVLRAEDFPAGPDSPRVACLAGVRQADVVVLVLGERYGTPQASGLSATHEEYREARNAKPVLVFIQTAGPVEPSQQEFIREVQGWEKGHFTANFRTEAELQSAVTRAVHEFLLAHEAAPLNESGLAAHGAAVLPDRHQAAGPQLAVVIAPGPLRAVLRPAELEDETLGHRLLTEALTGDFAVLTPTAGTTTTINGDALELAQRDADRRVRLDESGRLLVVRRAVENSRRSTGITSLIEEDVSRMIEQALRFGVRVLDQIDPVNRLSHVAVMVALTGAGCQPWRTRQQQADSPNAASVSLGGHDSARASLTPAVRRRAALAHETHTIAEDLTVRLRRELSR